MRIFKIGALIGLMTIMLFNAAFAEWTGASGEQFISYFPEADQIYTPALAVGPNFELYAIWAQKPQLFEWEIYFSKSTDNGLTWSGTSADQIISANDGDGVYNGGIAFSRRIDIAVNSLGYIYVVWPEYYITASFDTTQEIMMVMSTDGGDTWIHSDTDFPISDTASIDPPRLESTNTPNIAIDSDDNIHVIWNQEVPLGYPDNFVVTSAVVFNDTLYIGTQNSAYGGEVWRSHNGAVWTQVNTDGFGDINNTEISLMAVFDSTLYAVTQNSATGGEVWSSSDGTTWSQANSDGFGDANNVGINSLAVLGSYLYAGSQNDATGGEIWRSSDGTSWSQANSDGFGDVNNIGIATMANFGGSIYAGTQNSATGGEIWESSNGTTWSQVNSDGFGDANNVEVTPRVVFNGALYAGTANDTTGGELWSSSNGTTWSQINTDGFGDPNNVMFMPGAVFKDTLYIGSLNSVTGGEVWASYDGTNWIQIHSDGFGGPYNVEVTPEVVFNNYLYILTANYLSCGEVWRSYNSVYWGRVFDNNEIFYSKSSDLGATWTGRVADRMISYNNQAPSFYSDIDVGPDDKIHLVWVESFGTYDQRVYYGVSADAGATFSCENSDSVISTATYLIKFPRIKAKPFTGHAHVIYAYNDTAMYVGTSDSGATWNETMIWPGESYDMYAPDIAVTTTGTMVAILDEQHPGTTNRQIFASYSFDYGQTWSVALDPVSHYEPEPTFDRTYVPSVLITNTDVLHCLYSTNRDPNSNSYQEMAYSRNDSLGVLPGAIRGTVTELDESTPIENVEVTVFDSNMVEIRRDTTSATGAYYFGLAPATYSLTFSKYTHQDTSLTDVLVESNLLTVADISMTPVTPGTVSGNVYEETGTNPLEFVAIEAVGENDSIWAVDTTDAAGAYELSLWPGVYDISFSVELFHDTTISQVVTSGDAIDLDVNMTWAIPADEIGPISIDEPSEYMVAGDSYSPTITVENNGYQDQIFNLNLIIEDESSFEQYNETITGASVDSLGTVQLTFTSDFTPITPGDYTLTATITNDGDEEPGNDVLVEVVTAYAHMGFGGPDDYGYTYRDNTVPCGPTFNWIDISTTGTQIEPGDPFFMSDSISLGFSIEYYGYAYTTMYVNSHGSLHLGIRSTWTSYNDCPLPDAGTPNAPMILPFWDQKEVQSDLGQGVYYQYFDEPDVDYTVVQWNVSNYGANDTMEFEVILYENGRIVYQYNRVSPEVTGGQGQEATIGLEFDVEPELYGITYLCDDDNPANRLTDGLAIEWIKDPDIPGSITGTVTDASTLDPIENVFVEAVNLGISDLTDINGEYTLPGLLACDYSISFSHNDYVDTVVTGVTVLPDTTVTLDVAMQVQVFGYEYLPGDANMWVGAWPPSVIGGDVTYLVGYFRGINGPCLLGDETTNFYCSGDANGDCLVIGSDVTRLVSYFRGLATITPCPDYEPAWPTPGDLPGEAPSGWPNCLTPIASGNLIKGGLNSE